MSVMMYIHYGAHMRVMVHMYYGAHIVSLCTCIMGDTHECHWCTCIMEAHESHGAHVESEDNLKESVLSVLCGSSGSTGHLYSLSLLADPAFLFLKFY